MSTGAAGDGVLRGVFESCISGRDLGIKRRPYHKNCKCELHKARGHCTHSSRSNVVSYPIRRSWSEGCLALMNNFSSASASASASPSPTQLSPPIAAAAQEDMIRTQSHLVLCMDEGGDRDSVFHKGYSN